MNTAPIHPQNSFLGWVRLSESQKGFSHGAAAKSLPAVQETQEMWAWFLGWGDPLGREMSSHSRGTSARGISRRPQGQRSLRVGVRGVTRRSWSQHTCQEVTKLNHINSILQRHVYHYWVKNLRLHSYLSYVEEINKSTSYAWRSCTFCYLKSLHKDCIKMFSEDSLLRKCSSWKLGSCPLSDKETIQFNIFLFLCPNYLTILN